MPDGTQEAAAGAAPEAVAVDLDAVLEATPEDRREVVSNAVQDLVSSVMAGVSKLDKNLTRTINNRIAEIDRVMSKQLAAVMHHPDFQKLEGSWRGLHHLVMNSETGSGLKIRVFNCSKKDLKKDMEKAVEFDQSNLFKKVYESEFGMPNGEPYGALIGDYEIENHPEDLAMLTAVSGVAASAHAPFITSPSSKFFDSSWDSFEKLSQPRDLEKIFDSVEFAQWKSFRESEDSRYVVMAMPRTLARLPYGENTKKVEEFGFEEVALDEKGRGKSVPHHEYCWMSTSYVLGAKLTEAYAKTGWCTAIRGAENGGKVEGLPAHNFTTDEGDVDLKCPTEIAITDRREAELSKLGFLPLCHYKNTDYAVFFGAQTSQKAKVYEGKDGPAATANAAISARLPYIMAASRIAHYLKCIARDKIGSFMEREDCEKWLNDWIANYVLADPKGSGSDKAKFPLAEAKIEVKDIPGKPGSYQAVAHLRPWLQLEELTTSLRMVAEIPANG
jgi:type VI secretion system protein ImpC